MGIKLSPRDVAVTRFIAAHRIAPLELIAEQFFERDPFKGVRSRGSH